MGRSHQYAQVPSTERSGAKEPRAERVCFRGFLYLVGLLAIVGGSVVFGISMSAVEDARIDNQTVYGCGGSPSEARSRGCHFEPLMSSWTHPLCFFPEVAVLYDDMFERWNWFSDPHLTNIIDDPKAIDELRKGNYTVIFTSALSSHDVHCLYAWRKLNYAMRNNHTWMDARTLDYSHSDHCAALVTESVSSQNSLSLLSRQRPVSLETPTEAWLGRNATAWPLLFHPCIPLQHF